MIAPEVARLRSVRDFDDLMDYLRDELDWPITKDMAQEDLVYDYTPEEVGLDPESAVKMQRIVRLRPLVPDQPWGIFYIEFLPGKLPITVLRKILRALVQKKRATGDKQAWELDDLLFISRLGEEGDQSLNLAHFSVEKVTGRATLRVVDWDEEDSYFHMVRTAEELHQLAWPDDPSDKDAWREQWSAAFALKPGEVAKTSKQLAVEMARLARLIRGRVNDAMAVESDKGPLRRMFKAFKELLLHDLAEDDFADMYAQTMTYGLFAARISRPAGITFDNAADMVPPTNPFLRDLLAEFTEAGGLSKSLDFDELGIDALIEMLNLANMDAIVADFDDKNPLEDPVIQFYELFLKEYDPEMRVKRGIFFTPRPVVSFIVRSVDEILRTEFGLADGLADTTTWGRMVELHPDIELPEGVSPNTPFVQILDPAVGTGTFLVEVIDLVHRTMVKKWDGEGYKPLLDIPDLWNEYVADHLLPRLYGYEIMMAPYAIAHMKIGLKLEATGYKTAKGERLRIYLTNTLEPASDVGQLALGGILPALAHEARAVNQVKTGLRPTVVVGNPPYSLYTANLTEAADSLIEPFRSVEGVAVRERGALQLEKNLQDDYVKFFGFALKSLSHTGVGVLGFISNHGYVDNRTLRGMRHTLLAFFPRIRVVDLHGSASRASDESRALLDQNVFAIQQGVAVALLSRSQTTPPEVLHIAVMGPRASKFEWLLSHSPSDVDWQQANPSPPLFLLVPRDATTENEYRSGMGVDEIFPLNSTGIVTARDSLVVQWTREEIESTLERFAELPSEEARDEFQLGKDTKDWTVSRAQADVREALKDGVQPSTILYRPFDARWTFYTGKARGFMCNPRRPVMANMRGDLNIALCTNRQVNSEFSHVGITRGLITDCTLSTATRERTYAFPLYVYPDSESLLRTQPRPNLSTEFLELVSLALHPEHGSRTTARTDLTPEDVLYYVYAVLHSPTYRQRYATFLKEDFPRIPATTSSELFHSLTAQGSELIALHLMEATKLDGHVTTIRGSGDFQIERVSYSDDTVWIDATKTQGFRGVSEEVWNFHIGGYQVCEKWLKDRQAKGGKNPRSGRVLTDEDIDHYQKIIVALSETIRIMGEIDEVIEKHGGWPDAFQLAAEAKD